MQPLPNDAASFNNDPVFQLLLSGQAKTLHDAESQHLDAVIPDILVLLRGPLSNSELAKHPLLNLMLAHGSRGWEDSIL